MLNQGGIIRITLCPSCLNVLTCVNRAIRGYDVLFCDSFEDSGLTDEGNLPDNIEKIKDARLVFDTEKKSVRELKGLCENCIRRDTCGLPRPRTGVWHCEEFEELP